MIGEQHAFFTYLWRFSFWQTFLNSYLLLPLLKNYYNTTRKGFFKRIRFAIGRQLLVMIIQAIVVLLLAFYVYNKVKGTVNHQNVFHSTLLTLVAIGNAFGFLIIFIAIGYSIVAIPRDIIGKSYTRNLVTREMAKLDTITAKRQELLIILENQYKTFKGIKETYNGDPEIEKWLKIGMEKLDQGIISKFTSEMNSFYDEAAIKHAMKGLTKRKVISLVKEIDWTNDSYLQLEHKEDSIKKRETYYRQNMGTKKLKRYNLCIRLFFFFFLFFSLFVLALEFCIPFEEKYKFSVYKSLSGTAKEDEAKEKANGERLLEDIEIRTRDYQESNDKQDKPEEYQPKQTELPVQEQPENTEEPTQEQPEKTEEPNKPNPEETSTPDESESKDQFKESVTSKSSIRENFVYYFYIIIIFYLVILFQYANMQIELKYLYRLRKKGTNYGSIMFYLM